MVKWFKHTRDDYFYGYATFYDKKKNIPYRALVEGRKDGSVFKYRVTIQGKVAEPIRGWWMTTTYFNKSNSTKSKAYPFTIAEKAIEKLGKAFTEITDDEYDDWSDLHPIQKQRRKTTDWGIYGHAPDGLEGWLDMVYGTLLPRNGYASRWGTQAEAKAMATKLTKTNPGWKFEVKQMGKVEYQHR